MSLKFWALSFSASNFNVIENDQKNEFRWKDFRFIFHLTFPHISMKCSLRNDIFNEIGLKIVTLSMKWITWLSNFVCEILLKIESYHFLIKYLVRKVIYFKSDFKDTEKIVFIGSTHFWSWNEPFFTFFVWYRWIYFGCFLSLLFQENSLKIFFFKKSMFVAFLYIALILGFSQSIVSRAWGDRFRPLVHPLESEVGPHRGPLHQPQDHSRVEKKVLTSTNQPPKSYFTQSLILGLIV